MMLETERCGEFEIIDCLLQPGLHKSAPFCPLEVSSVFLDHSWFSAGPATSLLWQIFTKSHSATYRKTHLSIKVCPLILSTWTSNIRKQNIFTFTSWNFFSDNLGSFLRFLSFFLQKTPNVLLFCQFSENFLKVLYLLTKQWGEGGGVFFSYGDSIPGKLHVPLIWTKRLCRRRFPSVTLRKWKLNWMAGGLFCFLACIETNICNWRPNNIKQIQ